MKSVVLVLVVAAFGTALCAGQLTRDFTNPGTFPVPSSGTGGAPGGAGTFANIALIPVSPIGSMTLGHVALQVQLVHGRASDLTMTLSHCGISLTLFSGTVNPSASLNGEYWFDDNSPITFDAAANAAQGVVPPGQYKPAQSMSVFSGTNATGDWVLIVADLASGVTGTAGPTTLYLSGGADFGGPISPALAIPDGGPNYSCVAPVSRVVNVPAGGAVGDLWVTLGLTHTFTSDLTIILSHGGVTATLTSWATPTSSANLAGLYTFDDAASTAWTQAVSGLPSSATVAPGYYRPLTPLSAFRGLDQAGPWIVSICDHASQDVGTLSAFSLTIAPASWNLEILQPNGAASVTVANSGGAAGNAYANMMTLAPGSFPNGWLHGVDMSFTDIAAEVSFGAPFFGTLGLCGTATTTIPGPIPSGITVYVASLELDASGSIVNFKPAFAYTTP